MHNDNTPHVAPSIAAMCPHNHALLTFHYPHTALRKHTHGKWANNQNKHNDTHIHKKIITDGEGLEENDAVDAISDEGGMSLTGIVKGRWGLLDTNNPKRLSSGLPGRLTSVKTSSSLGSGLLRLKHKRPCKHRASVWGLKRLDFFHKTMKKCKSVTEIKLYELYQHAGRNHVRLLTHDSRIQIKELKYKH